MSSPMAASLAMGRPSPRCRPPAARGCHPGRPATRVRSDPASTRWPRPRRACRLRLGRDADRGTSAGMTATCSGSGRYVSAWGRRCGWPRRAGCRRAGSADGRPGDELRPVRTRRMCPTMRRQPSQQRLTAQAALGTRMTDMAVSSSAHQAVSCLGRRPVSAGSRPAAAVRPPLRGHARSAGGR